MKSEITKLEKEDPEIKYPCLMTGGRTGVVVLFSNDGTGTVVNSGRGVDPVARYRTDWHMALFKPFTGTVELNND